MPLIVALTVMGFRARRKLGTLPPVTCAYIQFSRSVNDIEVISAMNWLPVGAPAGRGGTFRVCEGAASATSKTPSAILKPEIFFDTITLSLERLCPKQCPILPQIASRKQIRPTDRGHSRGATHAKVGRVRPGEPWVMQMH